MIRLIWRLTRGYRLTPWKSPYLRWRIETYSGLHSEAIDFKAFVHTSWKYRKEFLRYLRWAERMSRLRSQAP
jgi:hypothetical protein